MRVRPESAGSATVLGWIPRLSAEWGRGPATRRFLTQLPSLVRIRPEDLAGRGPGAAAGTPAADGGTPPGGRVFLAEVLYSPELYARLPGPISAETLRNRTAVGVMMRVALRLLPDVMLRRRCAGAVPGQDRER